MLLSWAKGYFCDLVIKSSVTLPQCLLPTLTDRRTNALERSNDLVKTEKQIRILTPPEEAGLEVAQNLACRDLKDVILTAQEGKLCIAVTQLSLSHGRSLPDSP